jgi:signal transduction histidine kinase
MTRHVPCLALVDVIRAHMPKINIAPADDGPDPSPAAASLPLAVSSPPDDRFFRHIVRSMRNGVIAIRRDGTVALMNEEAYRSFGLIPRPHDIGAPFAEVLGERPEALHALAGAFELSHLPNRAEFRLKDLDRVIGYTLSRVQDDEAHTVGAVMTFKDLTRVEQLEERERLRNRLASLGEMAAGIAHELKNPLAGIEVMAGLLRRQVPDSKDAQSLLADIMSEAKLANAIVVEMLEFVRPIRLQVEQTNLTDVLHQSVMLAETKVPRRDIVLTVNLPANLPTLDADYHQLCQVFSNLLTNAFEAMDGRGAIDVTASVGAMDEDPAVMREAQTPTPIVIVDVADDGPGVPAELTDRIFSPFFTTQTQGSGLGLAIVRKIVDAHEGRIDVSSSTAGGTRFRITLPITNATGWFRHRKD